MPLDDDVRTILDLFAAAGPTPVDELEPVSFRETYRGTALAGSHPEVLPAMEDRVIAGPGGDLAVRIYRPEADGPLPLVVFAHGGGWVIGDLDTHRLLELDGFDERVGALLGAIDDADVVLRHRLGDDGSLG